MIYSVRDRSLLRYYNNLAISVLLRSVSNEIDAYEHRGGNYTGKGMYNWEIDGKTHLVQVVKALRMSHRYFSDPYGWILCTQCASLGRTLTMGTNTRATDGENRS